MPQVTARHALALQHTARHSFTNPKICTNIQHEYYVLSKPTYFSGSFVALRHFLGPQIIHNSKDGAMKRQTAFVNQENLVSNALLHLLLLLKLKLPASFTTSMPLILINTTSTRSSHCEHVWASSFSRFHITSNIESTKPSMDNSKLTQVPSTEAAGKTGNSIACTALH